MKLLGIMSTWKQLNHVTSTQLDTLVVFIIITIVMCRRISVFYFIIGVLRSVRQKLEN